MALTAVVATLLPAMVTVAQVTTPLNPFPKANADARNKGRSQNDFYWGVFDGNREFNRSVASRVDDPINNPENMSYEFWQFPRPFADYQDLTLRQYAYNEQLNTLRSFIGVDDAAGNGALQIPQTATPVASNPITGGSGLDGGDYDQVSGPSTSAQGGGYHRSPAVPRTNLAVGPANRFLWTPSVPGPAGTQKRYSIILNIPTPPDASDTSENRISDARYTVTYFVRNPLASAAFLPRTRVVFVDQRAFGEQSLRNPDGTVAYFPFTSDATFGGAANQPGGVVLENTTTNQGQNLFVLADSVTFVQQQDVMRATPTTSPRHGGRKVIVDPAVPVPPATYPLNAQFKRDRISEPNDDAALRGVPTTVEPIGGSYDDDDFVFINDPDDPIRVGTTPNPASPYFAFESDNVSTYYYGPASLIDPQLPQVAAPIGTPQIPPPIVPALTTTSAGRREEAQNNQLYRQIALDGTPGRPTPYFSQMQVLAGRTEFVQDPELEGTRPNAPARSGTRFIEVGSVYAVDWLTGTPVWRFPDRTYLPANFRDEYGRVVPGQGLRNPVATNSAGVAVPTIPGIRAFDKNMDTVIQDDEVFLAPQGGNASGGISASITIVPRLPVRGIVQIPQYDESLPYNGVMQLATTPVRNAQPGRYFVPTANTATPVATAFVACNNGVVYAMDANGNNDQRYYTAVDAANVEQPTLRGQTRNGTTNVFWSFSAANAPFGGRDPITGQDFRGERNVTYFERLKTEVPGTAAFNSSPTLAYRAQTPTLPLTEEQRLFIGNDNGVLYALDSTADAGVFEPIPGVTQVSAMPYRKGIPRNVDGNVSLYARDLRWWFETRGAIRSSPAVSQTRHSDADVIPSGVVGVPPQQVVEKGVYVTTQEGRVYCVDWSGPVTKTGVGVQGAHIDSVIWDGSEAGAERLNDNFRFHNEQPATDLARADQTEGTIRPRWTFPQRYRDISDNGALGVQNNRVGTDAPDISRVVGGVRLAEPRNLAPIGSAPVLMDFIFQDPDTGTREIRHYVVVTANDSNGQEVPTQGRIYLLDQVGDRRDFLTNPQPITVTIGPNSARSVVAHPLDEYRTGELVSDASPVWTHRYQYDRPGATDANLRNSPTRFDFPANVPNRTPSLPSRRVTPTVFAAGIGRVWAIDIDLQTGAFNRWRSSIAQQRLISSIRDLPTGDPALTVPNNEPERTRLNPPNPTVQIKDLAARPILAYTYSLLTTGDGSAVSSLTLSGGPLQNRSNAGTPTPTVPPRPTNDPPYIQPILPFALATPAEATEYLELTGTFVNQNINDPITTTRGSRLRTTNDPLTDPVVDGAFQYPVLMATTIGGGATGSTLIEISTNVEGEQRSNDVSDLISRDATLGGSAALGWALTTDPLHFNERQILQLRNFGLFIGGPGGVSVVSTGYLQGLDPDYRNSYPKQVGAVTADPTFAWPFYPPFQPDAFNLTPDDGLLRPRGLYAGNPLIGADPVTGFPEIAAIAPDRDTGQSGFPLDQNGLFYDKRYAVDPNNPATFNVRTGPLLNGDGRVRLPGFGGIGNLTSLPITEFTNELADGVKTANPAGPGAPQPRIILPILPPVPPSVTPTPADRPVYIDDTLLPTDDVNPAANRVAWMYAPGQDGTLVGITPFQAFSNSGAFGSGAAVGSFPDGGPNGRAGVINRDILSVGEPKAIIVDEVDFNTLRERARTSSGANDNLRPNYDGRASVGANIQSRQFQGKRNFYEWGEKIYVVVFDALANTTEAGGPAPDPDGYGFFANGESITLQFYRTGSSSPIKTQRIRMEQQASGGNAFYNARAEFGANPRTVDPDGPTPAQLGVAFYVVDLSKGDREFPRTPGGYFDVVVTQNNVNRFGNTLSGFTGAPNSRLGNRVAAAPQGGATATAELANVRDSFAIANPLAIQAFLTDTKIDPATGLPIVAGVANGPLSDNANNSIGPLAGGDTAKAQYVDDPGTTGTNDPDKIPARYSQAITNGNIIERRVLSLYDRTGSRLRPTTRYGLRVDGDPTFFVPVAASAHYGNHGQTASTDIGANQRNLRIVNRSILPSLDGIRVASADLVWRRWPGNLPNFSTTPGAGSLNPARTPSGMSPTGAINPLPWESEPSLNETWTSEASRQAIRSPLISGRNDYPDIRRSEDSIRVLTASGDLTREPGSLIRALPAANGNLTTTIINPYAGEQATAQFGAGVAIRIPKYQPANLVAMHSLTSTYVPASFDDGAVGTDGPAQLPRNTTIAVGDVPRQLRQYNGGTGQFSNVGAITPWGYTARLVVYVDSNGDGQLNLARASTPANSGVVGAAGSVLNANSTSSDPDSTREEAYRIVEVWVGVPADLSLKSQQSIVDMGAVGHGFGIQNGLLGYGQGVAPFSLGFLPNPLSPGYDAYFKPFGVQNVGNVNMWNLRANQRNENTSNESLAQLGSGANLFYLNLRGDTSRTVDASGQPVSPISLLNPEFGILAAGADPTANNPSGFMPQVVTSLDPNLDSAWNAYFNADTYFNDPYRLYERFYRRLGGRHTLHKPLPDAPTPTLLSMPDIPDFLKAGTPPVPGGAIQSNPNYDVNPRVGVAVPIGTPSGYYSTKFGSAPFRVFEDHDTPNSGYQASPILQGDGVTISPAGPLYGNRNDYHPSDTESSGAPGAVRPILPNNGRAEGTYRPRRLLPGATAADAPRLEFLPGTDPTVELKIGVTESALTGQVPDRGLPAGATSIITGLLPGADLFPIFDPPLGTAGAGQQYRPVASLSPAAFRDNAGRLHVYFASNSVAAAGNRIGDAVPKLATDIPNRPLRLFRTSLGWDNNAGAFLANVIGAPTNSANGNTGRWFSPPTQIQVAAAPNDTNTSPFVLEARNGSTGPLTGAGLYWVNSRPVPGGAPVTTIYTSPIGADGSPTGANPLIAPGTFDPSVRRATPRAVRLDAATIGVFYSAGLAGRLSINYVAARDGNQDGAPDAPANREIALPIPAAIASVSDVSPVVRTLVVPGGSTQTVVDVYYTGISRATQTPAVYLTRYAAGRRGLLTPITLPRTMNEELRATSRATVWSGQGISWIRNIGGDAAQLARLPVLSIRANGAGPLTPITNSANWRFDTESGVLYQSFKRTEPGLPPASYGTTIVTIDTSAGSVRFRGPGAPTTSDLLFASYEPTSLRISGGADASGASGTFTLFDRTPRLTTDASNTRNGVLTRPVGAVPTDRLYIYWQTTARTGRASALFQSTRRVGIDLKSTGTTGGLTPAESLTLGNRDVNGNQQIAFTSIEVLDANNNVVATPPFDVDFGRGRIFVASDFEGLRLRVVYNATNKVGNAPATNRGGTAIATLGFIEELGPSQPGLAGREVPMVRNVNEGQPFAFLDQFDVRGSLSRGGLLPRPGDDPTLQPGRVWLFWSSPRGRLGSLRDPVSLVDTFPAGYDIYWQTLAPAFESLSTSGLPASP